MVGATPSPHPNQGVRVRAFVRAVGEGGDKQRAEVCAGLALYLTDPSAAAVTLTIA